MTLEMTNAAPLQCLNADDNLLSSSDAPFPPHSIALTTLSDGLSIFGRGTNGKGVLLVHGVTGSPVEMKYIAKRLHRAGYTVYAPLLAGHGIDVATLRATRWKDWYRTVQHAADWLADRVDHVYVAGICVGGMIGLRLAHQNKSIKAAAVYSPLLVYDGWNAPYHYRLGRITVRVAVRLGFSRFIALKERAPYGIKSDRIRRLIAERENGIRGTLPAFPVDTLHQNYKLFDVVKRILPEIQTPTLLVHARQDDLSSPRNPLYIKRHIGGRCEIEWLENSYHMIHVDQEHAHVADRTRAFFDAVA